MNKDKNLNVPDEFKNIYKVLNKLEQRISTLEKVLASHAKCIGEMRDNKGTKTIDERTIL
jgi:wobble nucleotide-excising tRNase